MKKFLVFFLVLSLAVSFAAVADEGLGFSVGVEAGVGNVTEANNDGRSFYLMPMVIYDNALLDGALDIYAELDYTFDYTSLLNDDSDGFPQSVYFDLMFGYNLGLGAASTLSFILENEFDEFIVSPKGNDGFDVTGIFTPAVKFTQGFGFGDIYAKAGAPITYIQEDKDADMLIGLDFTLGLTTSFGLGLEAKVLNGVKPEFDFITGFEATLSYESGPVYCEVWAGIPKKISEGGMIIVPEFDFSFSPFTFYVKCEFAGVGADGGEMVISPALGFKFNF